MSQQSKIYLCSFLLLILLLLLFSTCNIVSPFYTFFLSYFVAVPVLQPILDYFFSSSVQCMFILVRSENHIFSHPISVWFQSLCIILSSLELTIPPTFAQVVIILKILIFLSCRSLMKKLSEVKSGIYPISNYS